MARIADAFMYGGAATLIGAGFAIDWRMGVMAVGAVLIGIGVIIAIGVKPHAG